MDLTQSERRNGCADPWAGRNNTVPHVNLLAPAALTLPLIMPTRPSLMKITPIARDTGAIHHRAATDHNVVLSHHAVYFFHIDDVIMHPACHDIRLLKPEYTCGVCIEKLLFGGLSKTQCFDLFERLSVIDQRKVGPPHALVPSMGIDELHHFGFPVL